MSDLIDSTSTGDGVSLSSVFLDVCAKVRKNDPSILPEPGEPLRILHLTEKEDMELADALLENNNVTYLQLGTEKCTKSSAEAIAKYVRTSKRLQRIRWNGDSGVPYRGLRHHEETLCCFLAGIQESTSLKVLDINLPPTGGPSNLALESMLAHTQSLRSLSLIYPYEEDIDVAAASSGLKKNTTLRELTLEVSEGKTVSSILTSLHDHPVLRRLCFRGHAIDLTGLETLLLSDTSKITELDIYMSSYGPMMCLTPVLRALARRPTLIKLGLRRCLLGRDNYMLLQMALCHAPSLQSLVLASNYIGSAELGALAPALYHNKSIKVLDVSGNDLNDIESAEILLDILCRNKTITTLDLSGNELGQIAGAVECIADGLCRNSTLLTINLSDCGLGDAGISIVTQTLGSRNTTLQKLTLKSNSITATGVGVLLETIEQSIRHLSDLDLQYNSIWNEGASLLARSLRSNVLSNLTHLFLSYCMIGDDGFIALVSALEQNTSLLHLELHHSPFSHSPGFSERAFLALAMSLPEIKTLQRVDFSWCTGLVSAMPLLLVGLRKNKSLFRFHVANCAPSSVPPTAEDTARCTGGWMQEMERLGYRNRFLTLINAPEDTSGPRGYLNRFLSLMNAQEETRRPHSVWPRALARVATLPDVIFEVLRSRPNLVPPYKAKLVPSGERIPPRGVWPRAIARVATLTDVIFEVLRSKPKLLPREDTEGKEAAKDTGVPKKRKRVGE
jgi:Leucine-rich repeat (LRR) protein